MGNDKLDRRSAKLLTVDADGAIRHLPRAALVFLFSPGDLIVANDAATLPASLNGSHCATGEPIEIRLAGWVSVHDPTQFTAVAFGGGDYRTRTEDRLPPPPLSLGDRLVLGSLAAVVEQLLDHPRLFRLRFLGDRAIVLAGLARYGRPIQYAHLPEPLALWDIWTRIAADPIAFEAPSAGFALDWSTLGAWRRRGIGFAALSLAAGISSTGDPLLDQRLPFDEPYEIPEETAAAIARAQSKRGRIVAIGLRLRRLLFPTNASRMSQSGCDEWARAPPWDKFVGPQAACRRSGATFLAHVCTPPGCRDSGKDYSARSHQASQHDHRQSHGLPPLMCDVSG
jgi:S-adenosylmethionine:tRNA ribosyltransferase-isomerase